jgi:hypothetical protein
MPTDDKQWASVGSGKKGYGPLASHTVRLAEKLAYTGPGPGD